MLLSQTDWISGSMYLNLRDGLVLLYSFLKFILLSFNFLALSHSHLISSGDQTCSEIPWVGSLSSLVAQMC